MATSPQFVNTANNNAVTFVNADGTALKTLITAGANGTKVMAINANKFDGTARFLELYWSNGVTDFLIAEISLPIMAGLTTNNAVDLLSGTKIPALEIDNNGNRFLRIKSGESIKVAMDSAVSGGGLCQVCSFSVDF